MVPPQAGLEYSGRVEDLPFDKHWLIAQVTPRFLFIAAQSLDDPYANVNALTHGERTMFRRIAVCERIEMSPTIFRNVPRSQECREVNHSHRIVSVLILPNNCPPT
jgi:hypothetical protein